MLVGRSRDWVQPYLWWELKLKRNELEVCNHTKCEFGNMVFPVGSQGQLYLDKCLTCVGALICMCEICLTYIQHWGEL